MNKEYWYSIDNAPKDGGWYTVRDSNWWKFLASYRDGRWVNENYEEVYPVDYFGIVIYKD